jgi:hypothetical protein
MYRETKVLPPKFLKKVLETESALIAFFEGILRKGVNGVSSRSGTLLFGQHARLPAVPLSPAKLEPETVQEDELIEMTSESIMDAFENKQQQP